MSIKCLRIKNAFGVQIIQPSDRAYDKWRKHEDLYSKRGFEDS